MARRESTTTATLEDQAATDAELGLEDLPSFDEPDQPSREALLQDLDARSDALNGQALKRVRPSEQCGVLAGHGPLPGKRCEYPAHPMNQPHSWEVASEPPADEPGHVYDDTAQPTLPGTPEPEQTDYTVPTEASFKKAKLVAAPGLKAIAERLIADDESLEHLVDAEIRYFWRARGGTTGGAPKFASIKRPGVYEDYFSGGKVVFFVSLAADHVRAAKFTESQIEACLHERLCMTERDPDDHDAYRILSPDFAGAVRTLDRFGPWNPALREMRAHVDRLPPAPVDEADTDDDGEDGGDDE
jgi:hypothetical protein